jgi:hypothetical protein
MLSYAFLFFPMISHDLLRFPVLSNDFPWCPTIYNASFHCLCFPTVFLCFNTPIRLGLPGYELMAQSHGAGMAHPISWQCRRYMLSYAFLCFPVLPDDFTWFPLISCAFLWFLMTSNDLQCFPLIAYAFLWFPMACYVLTALSCNLEQAVPLGTEMKITIGVSISS